MLLLLLMFGSTLCGEPTCLSKFDYDEKMLMKLLRLEDMVAKFDTRVTDLAAKYAASRGETGTSTQVGHCKFL